MKIIFEKIPFLKRIAPILRDRPVTSIAVIAAIAVSLGFLLYTGGKETLMIRKSLNTAAGKDASKSGSDKDVGVLVGQVDTKSYVSRIEKEYYDIASRLEGLSARTNILEKNVLESRKVSSDLSKIVMDLDKRVAERLEGKKTAENITGKRGQDAKLGEEALAKHLYLPQTEAKNPMNLEMAKVGEIKPEGKLEKRYVYLPLGSFVKCTLLTGVYAPANESNPLPVLISVDEAFYGPNNSKIPLKGAFAIGKAVGDVVSKRAIIQIVSLSTVLPSGKVFEHEANLGYLADDDGHLGIQGEVIYNTGRQLSLNFLSGFLAGGAQGLSQAETSTVTGAFGQTSRNVTGDTGRYAMFSGLAKSAEGMSGYYQRQLEAMIPAVKIESGKSAVFVVQKGVQIEGLEMGNSSFDYIDN